MKKTTLLTLLLLSYALFSLAQNPLTGIENWSLNTSGDLQYHGKTGITLDQQDNEIERVKYSWNPQLKIEIPFDSIQKTYNENKQITSFFHIDKSFPEKIIQIEEEYFYDGDCLELKTYAETNISADPFTPYHREFSYYSDCKLDSVEIFHLSLHYILRYSYEDNKEIVTRFTIHNEEQYFERETTVTTYNDKGQITHYTERDFSSNKTKGTINEYDQYDNLTSALHYNYFHSSDTTIHKSEYLYEHIYNKGRLMQTDYTIWHHDGFSEPSSYIAGSGTHVYQYYCDDLLREKRTTSPQFPLGLTSVKRYLYKDGHDCPLPEEEDLLTIRPNFTQDYVYIESTILETENSIIAIYDMSGRLVKQIKTDRIHDYHLYIGDLPLGNYMIHVFNKNYSAAERVLKI